MAIKGLQFRGAFFKKFPPARFNSGLSVSIFSPELGEAVKFQQKTGSLTAEIG